MNKKGFLLMGISIALLLAFVPFLVVFITSGSWTTTSAFGIEILGQHFIFTISFIISLLVIWYTLYLYLKE